MIIKSLRFVDVLQGTKDARPVTSGFVYFLFYSSSRACSLGFFCGPVGVRLKSSPRTEQRRRTERRVEGRTPPLRSRLVSARLLGYYWSCSSARRSTRREPWRPSEHAPSSSGSTYIRKLFLASLSFPFSVSLAPQRTLRRPFPPSFSALWSPGGPGLFREFYAPSCDPIASE